jgi:hypothetical protein
MLCAKCVALVIPEKIFRSGPLECKYAPADTLNHRPPSGMWFSLSGALVHGLEDMLKTKLIVG